MERLRKNGRYKHNDRNVGAVIVPRRESERERDGCMPCGFRDRMAAEQPREYNSAGGANSTPPERRVDTIGTPVYRERVGPLVAIHTLETKTT